MLYEFVLTKMKSYDNFLRREYITWKGNRLYSMEENQKYVCSVCGYVHEGDINSEPDDYVCPVCGVGKDMFEQQ